mgnify:CR=1 FL=1
MYIYNPIEDCYATKKKIEFFRDEIKKIRNKKKKISILDFGCGNANDCGKFLLNNKDEYLGFDIHSSSIKFATQNFKSKNISFSTILPKKKFDVIIISEVLEHLENPASILIHLKKQLNKDGFILGSIPNGYGLTEIEKFLIHRLYIYKFAKWLYSFFKKRNMTKSIPFNYESGHIQHFTLSSFKRILAVANLKLEFLLNGTLMGADISGSTILKSNFMKNLNTRLADLIPSIFSATWIFKLNKND